MIRVVIDTNVVVSANLSDEGLPASILDLAANKKILMIVSEAVLAEYADVLRRPRLKLEPLKVENALGVIRSTSKLVKPKRRVKKSPDESDNRYYECAEAGKANFLVTGNAKDFPENHKGTQIVNPRQFIDRIGPILIWGSH
jgi:putative PIN family toxin of toxin-antitoxin system